MPSGDKQKRKAKNTEASGEKRGSAGKEALARAWASVALGGGGKKSGSGPAASASKGPASPGGAAKAARSAASSSSSARKGLRARKAGDR